MGASATLKVLVISSFTGDNANVIRDFLLCFNQHSAHEYDYVFAAELLDPEFDFGAYDVILLFWSLYLLHPTLSEACRDRIRDARGLKILMLQDEYRNVREFNGVMARLGVQIMLTCVAERDHDLFYPRATIPSLRAVYTVLTGYVPEYLERQAPDLKTPRPLDVAYRSRAVPYWLGDLGQEKFRIAQWFSSVAANSGLRVDISVREEDRIYGDSWVKFLASARCTLGTESGASIVDFDGTLKQQVERHLTFEPDAPYETVRAQVLAPFEGKAGVRAISPRMFESAALGNALICHEGYYSGALAPDRHFIPVKLDYSNTAEVLERVKDVDHCRKLAQASWDDLIASGRYSYRTFAKWFDGVLEEHRTAIVAGGRRRSRFAHTLEMYRRGQSMVPRGNDVVHLPSIRSAGQRFRRALTDAGKHLPLPASVRRILSDPGVYAGKALAAVWVGVTNTAMRRLWITFFKHRQSLRHVRLDQVAEDVTKLAILKQLVESPGGGRPVDVTARHDPDTDRLAVETWKPSLGAPTASASTALMSAPANGRVYWNHSRVAEYVTFTVANCLQLEFFVGESGVHVFRALEAIAAVDAPAVSAALQPVLARAALGDVPAQAPLLRSQLP